MSSIRLQDTAGLLSFDQNYGENPLAARESDLYRAEFVPGFVDKWDTAEPEYLDDGLARFKYTFPDGGEYTLNMLPLRKDRVRRLLREAGFEGVRTYGDFQESYQENAPDVFIHVAEKSLSPNGQRTWPPTPDESLRNGR